MSVEMLSIQEKLWKAIEPTWNLYCPEYNSDGGFVEISVAGLTNHLRTVKHELWNNLLEETQEGYKFLLDYFPHIKGSLPDKLWIIVEEANKVYGISNIIIIDTTDEDQEFDFIPTIVRKPKSIVSSQFNSLFDVYVALHTYTIAFDSRVLAYKFFVSVKDKLYINDMTYVSEEFKIKSFWARNPSYTKILSMSDEDIIEKFNSKITLIK